MVLQVENISENSGTVTIDDWIMLFSEIIQKLCQPICVAWLEKECPANRKADKVPWKTCSMYCIINIAVSDLLRCKFFSLVRHFIL